MIIFMAFLHSFLTTLLRRKESVKDHMWQGFILFISTNCGPVKDGKIIIITFFVINIMTFYNLLLNKEGITKILGSLVKIFQLVTKVPILQSFESSIQGLIPSLQTSKIRLIF